MLRQRLNEALESVSPCVRFIPGLSGFSTIYTKDKFSPLVPDLRGSPSYLKCTKDLDENIVPWSSGMMNMCIIHNSGISGYTH